MTDRRSYEFRIALAVWAAYLLAAEFVTQHSTNLRLGSVDTWLLALLSLAAFVPALLHAFYVWAFVRRAMDRDSSLRFKLQQLLVDQVSSDFKEDDPKSFAWTSSVFQTAMSLALAGGLVFAIWQVR